ncbi:ArsR/SmtB family transcription factor [Plantactinospora sp. CA-290183]|uniref:ArsR/SmtB family transcription factor n=1 Tax=Plantactinospora sp. CA-290183 TaxID=3240006 RepID=UPI003D8BF48E
MIRIWLGAEDIARTRIAPAPLPLHEVFISLSGARPSGVPAPAAGPELGRWLRELHRPAGGAPSPAAVTGAARQPANLLAPLPVDRGLDGALARLLDASVGRAATLVAALRGYHDRCVAAELAAWEPLVRLDVGERGRALATGGVEALLAMLDPWADWRNPVLTVASGVELDLRPEGSGLLLVPSVFARQVWVGGRPESAVVVYPVRRPRPVGHRPVPAYAHRGGPATGDPLTALLGRSRAAVLRAARAGANTTDLARRAGISTPSASQHASVLRDAGLLRTTRHGKAAHHTLTPLARALLTNDDVRDRS